MNTTTAPVSLRLVDPGASFVLAQGQLVHLGPAGRAGPVLGASAAPWRLQVQAGAVWVTWPGCGDDVFLSVGEEVAVPAGVTVLVEAEPRIWRGAARLGVSLREASQPGTAARLWRWVRRLRVPGAGFGSPA
ncbi:MAG TPA: DUF2917 domain-containing protein [Ideonella sp.]|uniref:DUF2917 domain-containing protein n=1 Tax=Ideonella sp. TaxID=1929293 RepID=UPI002CD02F1B|nr:DUF2917 domain-containing protein [Ideonella sp.]HSI51740.1 DUF2917 domain-containing protein [Ideonella sp.]